jgi:hypothetical protein
MEPFEQAGIFLDMTLQQLDGHGSFKGKMRAKIYLCHTTTREEFFNPNPANGFAKPIRHAGIIRQLRRVIYSEME